MTDYISREAVLALADDFELTLEDDEIFFEYIAPKNVKALPAADVRPVVLCRDCEMASPCSDDREMYCTLNHCYKGKTYFCADGKGKNYERN